MRNRIALALAFTICGSAQAAVIVGNSVSAPYQNSGTNSGTKAVGFQTGSSPLLLESIQVALGGLVGTSFAAPGTVTFTLNANADPLVTPGALITTIGTSPFISAGAATSAYTITPVNPIPLAANTIYWIQTALGFAGPNWDRTNPAAAPSDGLAAFVGYRIDGSTSGVFNSIIVNGSVAGVTTVPEPSTLLLFGAAFSLALIPRMRAR